MPEFHSDSLVPPKHGVISPFAMITWCAIMVVFVGVVAVFGLKFDFSRLRGADHFISKARQAVTAKDWAAAVEALRHVQEREREKSEFLRVLADYLEASRSDPSLLDTVLDKLDTKGLMLPVDYIWACRLHIMAGNVQSARDALNKIPNSARKTAEFMKLNVELFRQEGRLKEATEAENLLFETLADDPEIAVRKAVRDLDGAFSELQQAALKKMWEYAKREDEAGVAAIIALGRRPELSLIEVRQLYDRASHHSAVPITERLQITSRLMRMDPPQHDQLLEEEIKRYASLSLTEKSLMASWLAREKEYDKILALVPLKVLMKSAELFPQVAQSLAEKGKWAELMELVKKGKKLPVSEARAATWRALAFKNLHPDKTKDIRTHLLEAIQESSAEKSGLALMGAAMMAEEWSMADLALKAYESMAMPGTPQEAEMLDRCWRTALVLKDANVLLKLADRRCRLKPGNLQLAQLRDYMHLLCGEQLETAMAASLGGSKSTARENNNDATLVILALKAYRLHDLPELKTLLAKVRDASALNPGERAVYAGLQALNGQTARAFQVAESVRPELLLAEEAAFLKMAF